MRSEPVISTTPPEGWLMTQFLIRGLELATTSDFTDGRRVTLTPVDDDDDHSFALTLDRAALGPVAEDLTRWRARPLWLRLIVDGRRHRWRETWLVQAHVEGASADEAVLLNAEQPVAQIEAKRGAVLRVRPLVRHRFARATPLPLCEPVRLSDVAYGRQTLQSSAAGSVTAASFLSVWMVATEPESQPWWQLDTGASHFIESLVIHANRRIAAPATISLHTYATPSGEPQLTWTKRLELDGSVQRVEVGEVGRYLRVSLDAGEDRASLELADLEVWATRLAAPGLLDNLRRTFTLFAERPLFAERQLVGDRLGGYDDWSTYAEVWTRALELASGLAELLEPSPGERVFVALCARGRPDWPIADIACVLRAYVVVPLAPTDGPELWAEIISRCGIRAVVCEPALVEAFAALGERCPSLELVVEMAPAPGEQATQETIEGRVHHHRLAALMRRGREHEPRPPAPREGDMLYTLLFTSGSTGRPKGAMRSYAAFNAMVSGYGTVEPAVHLAYQPFSHLSERMMVPVVVQSGGQVGFGSGDPANLFDDIAALEPTVFAGVPRVFDVLRTQFHEAVTAARAARPEADPDALEAEVLASLRALFGRRLQSVAVGSAKPSAALLEFLARLFPDVWMVEGYGITEVGTIAVDGVIQPGVDVELVDVPELSYLGTDDPPRGEIYVRTAHMISGYWGDGDKDATPSSAVDDQGYFRTGDIGQRGADGTISVIGRRKDVVKLAQGEFVAPERIEGALLRAAIVDQIYVHASPERDCVVAIVVPSRALEPKAATEQIHAALRETGEAAGLRSFELPAAIMLEPTPMTVARGLRTSSNKPKRRAIAAHYADQLDALYREAEGARAAATLALVADVAGELIGEVDPRAALSSELGVDSLAGVQLVASLHARLGREIPLDAWFGATSLADFARRLDASGEPSSDQEWREDFDFELELGELAALPVARPPEAWTEVLLTGATGFLGRSLLETILRETDWRVTCLVRGASEAEARARLDAALEISEAELDLAMRGRIHVLVGDLAAPQLGLDRAQWDAIAGQIDAIVHAGAVVNWIMRYGQVRDANVLGTRSLLALASTTRLKPVHHVSTISTAPATGDEDTQLSQATAVAGSGYALSKWIAERDVRRASALGLPVTTHRPGMVAAHSTRGVPNPSDFLTRYVHGCVALGRYLDLEARLDMTPVDFVSAAIVALTREPPGQTYHLVNIEGSPSYRGLGLAMVRAGVELEPSDYTSFRAALVALAAAGELDQNPLLPLLPYFPAACFGLAMGPWPNRQTRAVLDLLDLRCPVIDDAYVARLLSSVRDEPTD